MSSSPIAPFFSVLLTTYNQEDYLTDALVSLAAQTVADWELIVVDDGSTDGTASLLERWVGEARNHDFRVTVVRQRNMGQSAAIEAGFAHCRGRYVALLDSDDCWLPNKLERIWHEAQTNPDAGMLVHPMWVIDPAGKRTGDRRPRGAKLSSGNLREQVRRIARHVAPPTSGVVLRADVLANLLPMPTHGFRSAADAYLTFAASLLATVHAIDEPLGEYRLHHRGHYLTRMLSPEGLSEQIALQACIAEHFGLGGVVDRNSFFARNTYAWARMKAPKSVQGRAWAKLLRAIAEDPGFTWRQKAQLLTFWSSTLLMPRPAFLQVWRWYQMKQSGFDKLDRSVRQALRPRKPGESS